MTWNDPTTHVPTASSEPADATPQMPAEAPGPKKRSKWLSVGVPVATAVLAFGLGSGAGSSGAQTQIADLRSDQTSLTKQVETAKSAAKDSEQELASVETQLDERKAQETKFKSQSDQQTQKITDLTASNTKLAAENGKLQTRVTELETQAATAPAPFAGSTPQGEPTAPTSVYFKNCAAARAAGAAPVHRGDPGYAAHLDRDGDGVGCE